MKIGYIRISTPTQSITFQEDALKAAGCERFYKDVASGAKAARPGLAEALDYCRDGDTLVVWKLDRLGRSLRHLIETVHELEASGIGFHSLTENIDTTTIGGRLIFHIFGALAEFERDLIQERVQAGLKAARARGRNGGRPEIPKEKQEMARILMADKTRPIKQICKQLGVSKSTLYKYAPTKL